jgi:hypothetical protein
MKLHKNLLYVNGIVLLAFVIFSIISGGGSIGIGIAFSLLAIFNLPVLIIFILSKNGLAVRTCLIIMGVLLLVGFSICSSSSWGSFH